MIYTHGRWGYILDWIKICCIPSQEKSLFDRSNHYAINTLSLIFPSYHDFSPNHFQIPCLLQVSRLVATVKTRSERQSSNKSERTNAAHRQPRQPQTVHFLSHKSSSRNGVAVVGGFWGLYKSHTASSNSIIIIIIIIIILYTYVAHQTIKLSLMRWMRILTEQ